MSNDSGFMEIEHTADRELLVWAPDILMLLRQAVRGMYTISGTQVNESPRLERTFEIPYSDDESLLVRFLSEILYIVEQNGIAFDQFIFGLESDRLKVFASGSEIKNYVKEIKAVTYHNMEVKQAEQGLWVRIVFDV